MKQLIRIEQLAKLKYERCEYVLKQGKNNQTAIFHELLKLENQFHQAAEESKIIHNQIDQLKKESPRAAELN